ncbi:hypothetical protein R1sor_011229 [Riccia sorocarpa]|uniref:Uncharacterized protein n=1 Tax=Riccia sorocarpa TaxID=122646 RepID=A0ABD3I0A9_9MARC
MEPSAEFLMRSSSGEPTSQVTPQSSTSSLPMEKELGKFLLELKKGSTRILSLIQQHGKVKGIETEDDVAETLKRTLTPTPPTDLTPWKNSVTTLLRELSLERAHTQRLKKQRPQLELEVARGRKIPEMTSWVAEQLKLACDTEHKMSAKIEALEAALHAKGGHVTATEEESALHHLQAKMYDAHSKLDSLLGVSSSPEEGESQEATASYAKAIEEARALLATHPTSPIFVRILTSSKYTRFHRVNTRR